METKMMWCSDGLVSQVEVRVEGGVTLVSGDGEPWWASEPGQVHETEAEARRAWLLAEEGGHENDLLKMMREVDVLQSARRRIEEELQAAYRARDKARDALTDVQAQLAEEEVQAAYRARDKARDALIDMQAQLADLGL